RFIDPFTPNRPIDDPDRFFGREDSVNELVDSIYQIMHGNPKHTIITGARGVGKSSLLTQVYRTSTGDNRLTDRLGVDRGVERYDFVSIWQDVDSNQGVDELASSILGKFDSDLKKIFDKVRIEIDLKGFLKLSREKKSKSSISDFSEEFTSRMARIQKKAVELGKSGVLVFIDELDRIRPNSGISSFFKLVTERLNRENVKNTGFVCAGITGAVQKLEEEHSSILRTFRDVPLETFNEKEVGSILRAGFDAANHKYNLGKVAKKVLDVTSGLPEPVHLLGSEMLSVDVDGYIDASDFDNAIKKIVTDVRKNKLASILKKAGGGMYQKIVQAMAKSAKKYVPLDFIAKNIGRDQSQFSTNMATLIDRGVIYKPAVGLYAFCDPMLKEYVKVYGVMSLEEQA
ncbi:MAG: ATP-binding protein, partial [Spirochaetales bacterium]|nr:ATP-binding protein [Spirochaetales bacterium]